MKEKYIEDLKEIKDLMTRSSRFISLSGLSGISAGIIALFGAFLAHYLVFSKLDQQTFKGITFTTRVQVSALLFIAAATLLISIGLVIFLTTKQSKKQNQKIWDAQTKRILVNLAIPLFTGGIVSLLFLNRGFIGILPAITLLFYGMALVNVSKFTLNEIRSLGLFEIVLGLLAFQFTNYGLLFWAIGFGLLHIVYGFIIKIRYKS